MKPVFLGAYRLIAKLGRGRVTDVYLAARANQTGKDDLVVIKRLRTGRGSPEAAGHDDTQLPPEAELATRLDHPNIVRTYEFDKIGNAPYWAMEYVEGQPLDRLITAATRADGLPVRFGLRILCDLLSALEYAHGLVDESGKPLGIVHRDIRPHNIFITYDGVVKLADFGLPRPPISPDAATASSTSGRAFVAPEQAMMGSVDSRADIFAVGLVMWELLARQRRSSAEIPAATLQGLQPEAAAEPSPVPAEQTELLSQINDRALEREPDQRYASAQAMRAELERAIESLDEARAATAELTRTSLGELVQRLFAHERSDAARRVQLLLSMDGVAVTGSASPENLPPPGTHGVRPPPLRLSETDKLGTRATPRTSVAPEPPAGVTPDTSEPPALPRSEPPPSVRPQPRRPNQSEREGKTAAAVATALLVLGAVGVTWAMTSGSREPMRESQSAAIAKPEEVAQPVLRLCGSNTIGAELAPALVEGLFASQDSEAKIAHKRSIDSDVSEIVVKTDEETLTAEISARGTATGFAGLAEGTCDVAMASRTIEEAETKRLLDQGLGDLSSPANEHVIALDGVAVIVHPNNPISALDRTALHDIFTGKITDLSDLGGKAGLIHVFARDDQSGTYDTFKHLVLGHDALVPDAKRYALSDALSDSVASDPAAIGFVGLAYVRTAKALAVGEAGAAPLLPTQFTVATEGYMLSRRLYLYTPDRPRTPWVTELVNFAMSTRGQEIAGKAGFVNLTLLTDSSRCSEDCPPDYEATIANAQRVSVDLRFRTGSNQPDSRARRDMDRLVTFLRNVREPKVLLLGFSDNVGGAAANLKLSNDRAQAVAAELEMRGIHPSVVTGFGSQMPVASNDTPSGRQRNRRVEVWFEHE